MGGAGALGPGGGTISTRFARGGVRAFFTGAFWVIQIGGFGF